LLVRRGMPLQQVIIPAKQPKVAVRNDWPLTEVAGWGSLLAVTLFAGFLAGRVHALVARRREITWCDCEATDTGTCDCAELSTRFCPVCRTEYVDASAPCDDCGIELVDESEIPESDPLIDERLISVARLPGLRAQLVRQVLVTNRIPAVLMRSNFWGDLADSELFVFESDALRARRLIGDYFSASGILIHQ
jgi:hypothetical protein